MKQQKKIKEMTFSGLLNWVLEEVKSVFLRFLLRAILFLLLNIHDLMRKVAT
jgi:hypothetical protein